MCAAARPRSLELIVHQVVEFLSFTAGLVVVIVKSIYGTLAELLPAGAWGVLAVVVFVLVLHGRLAARIESVETAIELLSGKLDTILSHGARSIARSELREPNNKPGETPSGE